MRGGVARNGADSGASLRGIGDVDGEQEDPACCDELDWFSATGFGVETVCGCLSNEQGGRE